MSRITLCNFIFEDKIFNIINILLWWCGVSLSSTESIVAILQYILIKERIITQNWKSWDENLLWLKKYIPFSF